MYLTYITLPYTHHTLLMYTMPYTHCTLRVLQCLISAIPYLCYNALYPLYLTYIILPYTHCTLPLLQCIISTIPY